MATKVNNQSVSRIRRTPITQRSHAYLRLPELSSLALVISAVIVGLFALMEASFSTFILFFAFLLFGSLIVGRKDTVASDLFLEVYSIVAISAVVLYWIYIARYGSPYYIGGSDDFAYELWAEDVVRKLGIFEYGNIRGVVVNPWHNSVGYVYLLSLLYRLGELFDGFHTMIPRLFNGMCLGLLSVFSYRLAMRLRFERWRSVTIALFSGLLPIMVYNAIHTFRDVFIALILIIGVYLWTPRQDFSYSGSSRLKRWTVTILLALVVSEIRYYHSLVILIVAFVGDIFARERKPSNRLQTLYAFAAIVLATIVLFALRNDILGIFEQLNDSQEGYTAYRIGLSQGLGAYVFATPPPLGYILRIGYALISPLPTLSFQVERLLLSLGTLFQYFFLPFLALGFLWAIRQRSLWPLFTGFTLLFLGMALFTFAERHIVPFMPLAVILVALGYERYRHLRIPIWLALYWLGIGVFVLYILLR